MNFILIIIGLYMLSIGFYIAYEKLGYSSFDFDVWASIFLACAIVCTVAFSIIFFTSRYKNQVSLEQFKETQITIEQQRNNNMSDIERASLTNKIIDCNQWLIESKSHSNNDWLKTFYKSETIKEIQNMERLK